MGGEAVYRRWSSETEKDPDNEAENIDESFIEEIDEIDVESGLSRRVSHHTVMVSSMVPSDLPVLRNPLALVDIKEDEEGDKTTKRNNGSVDKKGVSEEC